jgi:hypothetical protein
MIATDRAPRTPIRNRLAFSVLATVAVAGASSSNFAATLENPEIGARLRVAYPNNVAGVEGESVMFKDGTRLPLGEGKEKSFEAWIGNPDISDMFRYPYPRSAPAAQPERDFDPGRARNDAFFTKVYGDCRKPEFAASLTTVRWLPKKSNQRLEVSRENGVPDHLKAVSDELDELPPKFDVYLIPSAGGFRCRTIAGTNRRSGHAYGIAIDIAAKHSHYWRWAKEGPSGSPIYRSEIPSEIVNIFERHGFIWGGRWYHYDTMHFEYRPELFDSGK